jgi:hypothetical protein
LRIILTKIPEYNVFIKITPEENKKDSNSRSSINLKGALVTFLLLITQSRGFFGGIGN